jgi:hypothetical protein
LFFTHQALLTQLPNTESFLPLFTLSLSTRLRKLRFGNFIFKSRQTLSSTLPSMLATITSSYVSEIEFAYDQPEGRDFVSELENDATSTTPGSSMWRALDDVLSTFFSLHTVRFRLSPRQSDPLSFVGYVKRGLSSCNARGVLSFEHASHSTSGSDPELGTCHSPLFCK